MRLLFDQNLSRKLVSRLADLFPDSQHVESRGLAGASDATVWDDAVANGFVIISKDDDFHHGALLEGPPPKVIVVGLGNCATEAVEAVIRDNTRAIESFAEDTDTAVLVIQ